MVLKFNEYIAENENRQGDTKSLPEVITGFKKHGYTFYGFMHPYKRKGYPCWDGPYLDHSDFTINKDFGDAYNNYFFEDNDIHYIPSNLIKPQRYLVKSRDDAYSESYNEHYNDNIRSKDGTKYYVFWCEELKYFYLIKDNIENRALVEKLKKERISLARRHREAMKKWEEDERKREEERLKREENDRMNSEREDKRKSLEAEGYGMYSRLYRTNSDAFKDITDRTEENIEIREKIEDLISKLEIPYFDVEMGRDPSGSIHYMRLAELDGVKYKYEIHTESIYSLD